jgi:hypothetical protein
MSLQFPNTDDSLCRSTPSVFVVAHVTTLRLGPWDVKDAGGPTRCAVTPHRGSRAIGEYSGEPQATASSTGDLKKRNLGPGEYRDAEGTIVGRAVR